jgi:ATP synthase A1 C subunit
VSDEAFSTYYSARIRAMKSRLLTRAQYDEILEGNDVQVAVDKLLNSVYAEDMADSLTRVQGADAVEDAVSRNLVKTLQKLYRGVSDDEYLRLAEIFLTRWDLAAVKSLLRCRHHGVAMEETAQELIPGPTLTVALLRDLAQRENMASLVSGLVAWNASLCGALQKVLGDYEGSRDLSILEEALDRAYFVDNAKALRGSEDPDTEIVWRVLQMEIDRINLRRLLTMRGEAVRDKLLPGGALGGSILDKMAACSSPEQVVELLKDTPYRSLSEGVYELVAAGRFSQMERLFEKEMMRRLRKASRVHVMGIAVLLEYIWMKYNEVMNLRLLARGEARHLPKGRIREEMVYV